MDEQRLRKLAHDLRGLLAPAMMLAERLQNNPDPAVQRSGTLILESLDRAVAAIGKAVE
jgi:hypothetical protein